MHYFVEILHKPELFLCSFQECKYVIYPVKCASKHTLEKRKLLIFSCLR